MKFLLVSWRLLYFFPGTHDAEKINNMASPGRKENNFFMVEKRFF
jgi:hypothetical protein